MEELKRCLPELRYLKHHLNPHERQTYINAGSDRITNCLVEVALNLMYSNKNGLPLTTAHIQQLKPFKGEMKKLILSKTVGKKKKILQEGLVDCMLSVLLSVVATLELEV